MRRLAKLTLHPSTVKILRVLSNGPAGFSEIMFESRVSPSVLTRTLRNLVEHGLVRKEDSKYIITDKGREVFELLEKLHNILRN